MERYVNRNEARVIAMSRSGSHAIVRWMLSQMQGRYCFLNCCQGKDNPFLTALPITADRRCWTNLRELDLADEQRGAFHRKDWLVFSHEDSFLAHACSAIFERHHDAWVGASQRRLDVLILRDPFNLFASRLHMGDNAWVSLATAARIWKQHARQLAERPRGLRHTPVLIRYDRWVREAAYRARIAEELGLRFQDGGHTRVPDCAGGSSFDGTAYDGAAHRMDVFGRWRHWIDDPVYRRIFDDEMLALSAAIFGEGLEGELREAACRLRRQGVARSS